MSRRKTILFGRGLNERLNACLGFPEYERAGEVLAEIEFQEPQIDWSRIESLCDHEVSAYSRKEIDFAFEAEIGFRVRKAVTRQLSGPLPEDQTSESEFLKKADKIASLAQKLTTEIDELAEVGSALILRPKRKDGLTSVEEPEEFYAHVTGRTEVPTSECFVDYYSFRKLLDYYANFSAMNGDFQSVLGDRFGRMRDYSWYETFVRRVVLALWPTNFPMTVTVPTDTNLDYVSPIILVLEELRRQFNELAEQLPLLADMHEEWTYRQHARLVLKLRDEFEESDIFWAQARLRQYDADQSAFAKNEL
jgi:hypothetical protein